MSAPDLTTTNYACPPCVRHDFADECWHSEAYWPIAVALAHAVHGPDANEEQQGWFVDDAEAIGSDVVQHLQPPYTAKQLGTVDTNLMPYLLNGRMVVALQGSDDGSGEVLGYAVALLDPIDEEDRLAEVETAHGSALIDLAEARSEAAGWREQAEQADADTPAALRLAKAEVLREAARYFEYEMAPVWGGDATWISTGAHVADLVAEHLRERAADLEAEAGR